MKEDVPRFVHDSFYPDGWEKRQYDDLARVLDAEPENVDVAMLDGVPVGGVCTRVHPEDQRGETHILAVDPAHRRHGIGRALKEHPYRRLREAGLRMAMVETGGDRGHAPARATYEAEGFVRWPVVGGALLQGPRPAGDGRRRGVRMFAAHTEPRTSRARFTRCAAPGTPVSTCARRCPGSGWSKDAWPDPGTRRSPRPPSPPSPRPSGGRAWSAAATPPAGAR